jgi:lysophospholipase L1-like esterase
MDLQQSRKDDIMESILIFGDSNTWGLVPGSYKEAKPRRYSKDIRWTGILQQKCNDLKIIDDGLCGRTTIFEDKYREGRKGVDSLPTVLKKAWPIDGAVIMLGTNDCKWAYEANADKIGTGIEACLDEIEKYVIRDKILLISPIHLGDDVWREDKDPEFNKSSIEESKKLKNVYKKIAQTRGIQFLAASDYANPDARDEEHLNEEGHKNLARIVYQKFLEMNFII